jgi:hypothetical protein
MTARFNDSVNGSAKQQEEAMERHRAVIQTMVPISRSIQNCGMISLMDYPHNGV